MSAHDLKIHVDQIRERGLELDKELPAAELSRLLAVEPPTAFLAAGAAKFTAKLTKVNDRDILLQGKLVAPVMTECRRCLLDVQVPLEVPFALELVNREERRALEDKAAEDTGQGELAGSFAPEEADEVFFSGKEVDLFPVLQEQLLLSLPADVLCEEACRGLCQICGKNLNEAECGCDRKIPDPRLAGLKNIKLS